MNKKLSLSELESKLSTVESDYERLKEDILESDGDTRLELEEHIDFFEIEIDSIKSQIKEYAEVQ